MIRGGCTVFDLSRKEVSYLRSIFTLGGKGVRLIELSRKLGVASPSALQEVRHLEAKGLVTNTRGSISLTDTGLNALASHRSAHIAIETLLAQHGISGREVCKQIHAFDYALPEDMVRKVYAALGKPSECPQGHSEC